MGVSRRGLIPSGPRSGEDPSAIISGERLALAVSGLDGDQVMIRLWKDGAGAAELGGQHVEELTGRDSVGQIIEDLHDQLVERVRGVDERMGIVDLLVWAYRVEAGEEWEERVRVCSGHG